MLRTSALIKALARCPRISASQIALNAVIAIAAIAIVGVSYGAGSPSKVVATVGTHKITQAELDARVKQQLAALQSQEYEIKRQAIDSMADEYLLDQAAKKESLTPDEYIKKHEVAKKFTTTDAKAYYDQHKELQSRYPQFDPIKDKLAAALQQQYDDQQRDILMAGLKKDNPVNVLLTPPRVEVNYAGHPQRGPADAPVTIIEFSDFQCPYCKRAEPIINEVREKYGDKVKLVYMDFPLSFHEHAMGAATAARCAADQGKFWEYHDQLFENQSKLDPNDLKATAKKVGLDETKFDQCLASDKVKDEINADVEQGHNLGVDGTPAFFINGRPLSGAQPATAFSQVIDEELGGSHQKQASAD
jgi:protein-disulfide isomerase